MKRQAILISSDIELAHTVVALLEQSKIEVTHAGDLQKAAETLHANPLTDLLIIDLALDDDRLIDLIHFIRHRRRWLHIPILALADLDIPDKLRAALNAGANRYVTKAFITGSLREIVQEMALP